jgi:hypothetical protein
MHSPTTIWKLYVISEIMSLHINIFWPKLILFICSTKCLWLFHFCPTMIWNIFMCFLLWLMWFWEYPIKNVIGSILIVWTCSMMSHNSIISGTYGSFSQNWWCIVWIVLCGKSSKINQNWSYWWTLVWNNDGQNL